MVLLSGKSPKMKWCVSSTLLISKSHMYEGGDRGSRQASHHLAGAGVRSTAFSYTEKIRRQANWLIRELHPYRIISSTSNFCYLSSFQGLFENIFSLAKTASLHTLVDKLAVSCNACTVQKGITATKLASVFARNVHPNQLSVFHPWL